MRYARIAAALIIPIMFAGCDTGTSPNPGGPLTFEQRQAAFDAITAKIQSTPDGTIAEQNQALVDFLRTRPEFTASDKTAGGCVWARFQDGRILVITNNDDVTDYPPEDDDSLLILPPKSPPPKIKRPSTHRAVHPPTKPIQTAKRNGPQGIPYNPNVHLINGFATDRRTSINKLAPIVTNSAHLLAPEGSRPTVEQWKNLSLAGVFFMEGHGGESPLDDDSTDLEWHATTNMPTNFDNDAFWATELDNGSMVYSQDHRTLNCNYGITAKFVLDHISFADGAMVFMNSCLSSSAPAASFRDACFEKGATLYVGWSDSVHRVHAEAAAYYLFDRMLGAGAQVLTAGPGGTTKNFLPELPEGRRLRPFQTSFLFKETKPAGYPFTRGGGPQGQRYNQSIAVDHGETISANLLLNGNPNRPAEETVSLLNPSIAYCDIDEFEKKLTLYAGGGGGFGPKQPVGGVVLINGASRNIESWEDDKIVIANFDASAGGKVQVGQSNEGKLMPASNPRWITLYKGVQSTWTQTGPGSLQQSLEWTVNIRGDFDDFRDFPDSPITGRLVHTVAAEGGAQFFYTVNGTWVDDNDTQPTNDDCTIAWTSNNKSPEIKAQDVRHAGNCPEDHFCFEARASRSDRSNPVISVGPLAWITDAYHRTQDCGVGPIGQSDVTIGNGGNQYFTTIQAGSAQRPFDLQSGWSDGSGTDNMDDVTTNFFIHAPGSVEGAPDPDAPL